jgi:hypothetical protein
MRTKIQLIPIYELNRSSENLINSLIQRIKLNLNQEGRVLEDPSGQGFFVVLGFPKTIKEFLFPPSSLTNRGSSAQLEKVKALFDAEL